MATFLEIANNIAVKIRLPELTNCYSSSDRNAKAIRLSIIQGAERDIYRAFDWSFLTKKYEFSTVVDQPYYDLPSDYGRIVDETFWNNTSEREVAGPMGTKKWAMYENDTFGVSAIDYVSRILPVDGVKKMHLIQTPSAVESMSYYYISDRYVTNESSLVNSFQSDDDTTLLDDDLVEQSALWRTLRILGLDYGEEKVEFIAMLKEQSAHDGGAMVLDQSRPSGQKVYAGEVILGANVPLTGLGE